MIKGQKYLIASESALFYKTATLPLISQTLSLKEITQYFQKTGLGTDIHNFTGR